MSSRAISCRFFFAYSCIVIILFCQNILVLNGQAHRQSEPININFLTSTPWDVANSLRTPLGGPLAIILAGFLSCIMLFGLLIAPVQYLFGDPERPYHYHDADKEIAEAISRSFPDDGLFQFEDEGFIYGGNYTEENNVTIETRDNLMDFHSSIFHFIPEDNPNCKNLMICHAHGFLSLIPDQFVKFYQFVSKKVPQISEGDKNAILIGLEDQGQCSKTYGNCSKHIMRIAKATFDHVVPRNVNFNLFTLLSYLD